MRTWGRLLPAFLLSLVVLVAHTNDSAAITAGTTCAAADDNSAAEFVGGDRIALQQIEPNGTCWGGSSVLLPGAANASAVVPILLYLNTNHDGSPLVLNGLSIEYHSSLTNVTVNGVAYASNATLTATTAAAFSHTVAYNYGGTRYSFVTSKDAGTNILKAFTIQQIGPSNHPTALSAVADSASEITTSWTDAVGAPLPDKYLVMCSTGSNFTNPVDGVAQANDASCGDGSGVQNITQGTQTASWTGLTGGAQYFFKIFPYTGTGIAIDYKTDGTPLTANVTPDGTAPSVVISGVPGATNAAFTATFTFSESVTGFVLGDISVGNGSASAFAGSGTSYTALITPAADGQVTIDVAANVAQDDTGNGNTIATQASTTYTYGSYVQTRTKRVIGNYMARRANQMMANEPNIVGRLNKNGGGGGAGSSVGFTGSGNEFSNSFAFSTSLRQIVGSAQKNRADKRQQLGQMMALGQHSLADQYGSAMLPGFDLWVQGKWAHSTSDTSKTDLGLFYTGVEYKFFDGLLLGVMGQMDWSDEKDGQLGLSADGTGWMIGPYMVARLHDNLLFDGKVAWGRSSNHVNPLGSYTDSFDTTRWMARGQLTGDFSSGNWHFSPHIGISYFEEKQKAYTDAHGIHISAQTARLGSMTFGPEVSTSFKAHDGSIITPHIGIKGIWDFQQANIINLDTGVTSGSGDDLRVRVEGGVTARLGNGWLLSGESFYGGIGSNSLEAYGGSARLTVPLN